MEDPIEPLDNLSSKSNGASYAKILLSAGVTIAVLGIFFGALIFLGSDTKQIFVEQISDFANKTETERGSEILSSQTVTDYVRAGEYESALVAYENIIENAEADPEERGLAVWVGADIKYKITGNIEDLLQGIRELKKTALDHNVHFGLRAVSVNTLANIYYGSAGRHPLVFEEIFKGEKFSQYRAEGDAFLSTRNLYEWSYGMYPISNTALMIARWYAIESFENKALTGEEIEEYTEETERLLYEAKMLADQEQSVGASMESRLYASYVYWTAFTRAALVKLSGELYTETYRDDYEQLILFLEASTNGEVAQYIPYAHWLYANMLVMIDNDIEEAKKHLNAVISAVELDPRYDANEFVVFVRNTPSKNTDLIKENNFFSEMILEMTKIDESFGAFISSINPELLE